MEFLNRKGRPVTFEFHTGDLCNSVVVGIAGQGMTLNPFADATEEELSRLLHGMCSEGLNAADLAELDDQIEAVVPAVVELRDAGFLVITARAIADAGKLEGLMELAEDAKLSDLSRNRCRVLRDRYIAQGVKALLGQL